MRLTAFAVLLTIALFSAAQAQTPEIAFVNVTVVPMDQEHILPRQTVIVKDGKIIAIGPANKIKLPKDAQRIDGSSKYLMPGLADMHAHYAVSGTSPTESDDNKAFSLLFVANGVTTVRNMWGTPGVLALRKQIDEGQVLGPRIFTTGPINGTTRPNTRRVDTAEQGTAAVAADKREGYDAVKLTNPPKAAYDAIVAAARKEGLPVYGHVQDEILLSHALELRQDSIEHGGGFVVALQKKNAPELRGRTQLLANVDWSLMPDIIAATRAAGTWVCPTLIAPQNSGTPEDTVRLLLNSSMKYIPRWLIESWAKAPPPVVNRLAYRDFNLKLVKALHDGGVGLLLGTDCLNPLIVPGFSIHEELFSFVEAGLTPFQALKAGTSGAAEFLKRQEEFGTVVVGRRADLILLEANPLTDVRNAAKRVGVMVRGHWFTEAELRDRLEKLAVFYSRSNSK